MNNPIKQCEQEGCKKEATTYTINQHYYCDEHSVECVKRFFNVMDSIGHSVL